jgi:hypothetical protein
MVATLTGNWRAVLARNKLSVTFVRVAVPLWNRLGKELSRLAWRTGEGCGRRRRAGRMYDWLVMNGWQAVYLKR